MPYQSPLFFMKLILSMALILFSCGGTRPDQVLQTQGNLAPCPETPNCVSTHSTGDMHFIAPLTYSTQQKVAMDTLVAIINSMKRTKIIVQKENYLYVEFKSAFWRFIDDVEFSFDKRDKIIHFRSASRLGKGDLGVNRKRMEKIRSMFNEKMRQLNGGVN